MSTPPVYTFDDYSVGEILYTVLNYIEDIEATIGSNEEFVALKNFVGFATGAFINTYTGGGITSTTATQRDSSGYVAQYSAGGMTGTIKFGANGTPILMLGTTSIYIDNENLVIDRNGVTGKVIDVSDIVSVLGTATDKVASQKLVNDLYVLVGTIAENGMNMGAFETFADLQAAWPNIDIKPGSYAYVRHLSASDIATISIFAPTFTGIIGQTWRFDQGLASDGISFQWYPTIMLETLPRNFTTNPIQTGEIQNGAVTEVKLHQDIRDKLDAGSSGGSHANLMMQNTADNPHGLKEWFGDPTNAITFLKGKGYLT